MERPLPAHSWTRFRDVTTCGETKSRWREIWVEAHEEEALKILLRSTGIDPLHTTCVFCGQDFEASPFPPPGDEEHERTDILFLAAPTFEVPVGE